MEVSARYNEEALNSKISGLSCISGGSIITTKMHLFPHMKKARILPLSREVQGNDDPEKTKQVLTAVVKSGSKEVSLEETGCYRITVGVWENDENLKAYVMP